MMGLQEPLGSSYQPHPSLVILQMGKPRAREGESFTAIWGLKFMVTFVFLLSLAQVLGEEVYGFLTSTSSTLNCCCFDLSEMQIGAGCFQLNIQ